MSPKLETTKYDKLCQDLEKQELDVSFGVNFALAYILEYTLYLIQ